MAYSIDKLTTPQLISASIIDNDVISKAIPTFSRSQLNGTTANTVRHKRKLVIQDGELSDDITSAIMTPIDSKYGSIGVVLNSC